MSKHWNEQSEHWDEHNALQELSFTDPRRAENEQRLWDAAIEADIKEGVGLVVALDPPVATEKGEAHWLFVCFYGILGDRESGWLPNARAPRVPIVGVSDRNHCIGIDTGDGKRTWVQLTPTLNEGADIGSYDTVGIDGVIDGRTNGETLRRAERAVTELVLASQQGTVKG